MDLEPSDVLLERDAELAAIGESIERAHGGEGTFLLIEGPAGIGKTALLGAALGRGAELGMRVLTARGGGLESEFAFGVARQLFEALVREHGDDEGLLAGAAGLAAPVVGGGPVDAAPVLGGPPVDAPVSGDRSFAVLHGLYWLTANIAERRPVLIAVDDLHWADAPSLRFLLYLARRLPGLPVALVACARPGEPTPEPTVLAQLVAEPGAILVRPPALSERAVVALIRAAMGEEPDQEFSRACARATGGIPFLLRELIAALAADGLGPSAAGVDRVSGLGPATVAHSTLLRVGRLPAAAGAVARGVAILGSAADPERVARLVELTLEEVLGAADALARTNILRSGSPLGFVHPIVEASVYDDMAEGKRAAGHARAAALFAADGAEPDLVTGHLLLSPPGAVPGAVAQLRAAARHALAAGAPDNAASYLRRALAERATDAARAELEYELAEAEKLVSPPSAVEHLIEARRLSDDPVLAARAARDLSAILIFSGQWEQGIATVDAALGQLGELDRSLSLRLRTIAAGAAAFDPRLSDGFDARKRELEGAIGDGVGGWHAAALLLASIAVSRGEDPDAAAALAARAFEDGVALTDERDVLFIPQGLTALLLVDQLDRAGVVIAEFLAQAQLRGSLQAFVTATSLRAHLNARRGDLVDAEADLRGGLAIAQEHGLVFAIPSLLAYAADPAIERPQLDDVALLTMSTVLPADFAASASGALALLARGRIARAQGDPDEAAGDLRAAGEILEALRFANPAMLPWRSELALCLAGEEPGEAATLVASELADARRIGVPRAVGVALLARGIVDGGEAGAATLREAVSVLGGSPARLELARAQVELGATLRRANRRVEAREPLAAGLELARRCGAERLAERALAELRASGARPRRAVRSGVDALTPSELRVAQMAAGGLTNPQIGQALFVTRNTIETHLRHVYQKLGINSREQLGAALGPGGGESPVA